MTTGYTSKTGSPYGALAASGRARSVPTGIHAHPDLAAALDDHADQLADHAGRLSALESTLTGGEDMGEGGDGE